METKKLTINIPKGYEIDREKSTFEEIIFKKIDNKPRTWEDYCNSKNHGVKYYIADGNCDILSAHFDYLHEECDRNTINTEEEAEAFVALMQLRSLRKAWVGDWEPNWKDDSIKYCILFLSNGILCGHFTIYHRCLSFPTEEMCKDFIECFRDLIERAKILI